MKLLSKLGRLRWQLMISYLPLIITPVLLIGLVTRSVAEQGVTVWVSEGARQQANMLSQCFAEYYQANGSWQGLSALLKRPPMDRVFVGQRGQVANSAGQDVSITVLRAPLFDFNLRCYPAPLGANILSYMRFRLDPPPKPVAPQALPSSMGAPQADSSGDQWAVSSFPFGFRDFSRGGETLITDLNGVVVASNDEENIGQNLGSGALTHGAPIVVKDQVVGLLVIGKALGVMDQQQRQLLDTVNGALVLSGVVSVVLAVGLGWGLSWRLSVPVQQLMAGVKRLQAGVWTAPVEVRTRNEFGELTEAFNTMASEVTRQQHLSRQMIADIAHDLRTPLSVMSLEVEAIEAGFQTPTEAATSLRQEITWLQRLVDDLRLLSLMDADQIRLQLDTTPLHPFMCGVYDFWQIMASEGGRLLTLDAPEDLPNVQFDASRMRQVLGNLIDNAIRHTKAHGKITLGARADSGGITIWVSDDGEGIAPADLPHVFDRFYRADPARARQNTGSGLGLSISRRLVEMHGGKIEVTSTLGHGATFTIKLPQKATVPKDPRKWVRHLDTLYPATGSAGQGTS
jgi:two-component system, OmpR family, sensor histidine kinase BaeS